MERRPLAKNCVETLGIHARDLPRVELPEPPLELVRSGEGLLHLHLLVEDHPDQEGKRVRLEQLVGGRVFRPDDGHVQVA